MTGRVPDDEPQVEATGDRLSGAAIDVPAAPERGGEHLTAATVFAPGLVSEATVDNGADPAER